MKPIYIDTPSGRKKALPKFQQVAAFIRKHEVQSVLDVGCRDGILRDTLAALELGDVAYASNDLFQNEAGTVDYVGDLAAGLPVDAGAYDMVTALDVLEHIDDFQGALDEMARIARRYIVVALPNMAHFMFRWRLLIRGRLDKKYDLHYGYGPDRHRWFTVLPQTNRYFQEYCDAHGYRLCILHTSLGSPRLSRLERLSKMIGFRPEWYVWAAIYVVEKPL